jgi:hypothetical protein
LAGKVDFPGNCFQKYSQNDFLEYSEFKKELNSKDK